MTPIDGSQPAAERSRYSRIRSVSQVMLTFQAEDSTAAFQNIRTEALRWLAKRAGRPIPNKGWAGESFEMLEVGAQPVSALAMEDPRYWCFRIDDADKEVPQRSWTTEAGILLGRESIYFGCRLQCVARGESPPFDATVPGLVIQVVRNHAAYLDGRRVVLEPWHVSSDDEVDTLVELLTDPARTRPVIVVSSSDLDEIGTRWVVDADALARRSVGAAHVVTLTSDASYRLTNRVGKPFSVFNGAVRTYRPGLELDEDLPATHPIALAASIADWGDEGAPDFVRFLVQSVLRDTVSGVDIYRHLPSFADIHAQVAERKRAKAHEAGASDAELVTLAMEENDSLRKKLKEEKRTYDDLLESAETEHALVKSALDEALAGQSALRARVAHLEAALRSADRQEETDIPDGFDELEEWCANALAGSVEVLPRALRAAAKSNFENPPLAYKALLILRDHFVPMKRQGGLDLKQSYEQALAELSLEDSPSFSGPRSGEQGDQYRVRYNGRVRHLDRHLTRLPPFDLSPACFVAFSAVESPVSG